MTDSIHGIRILTIVVSGTVIHILTKSVCVRIGLKKHHCWTFIRSLNEQGITPVFSGLNATQIHMSYKPL